MASYEVTYIRRQFAQFGYEGITHLGGPGWEFPVPSVIANIIVLGETFFTENGQSSAIVRPWPRPAGPYVRTVANGLWADNLLALPVK